MSFILSDFAKCPQDIQGIAARSIPANLEYFAAGILYELQRLEKRLELEASKALRLKKHHRVLLAYLEQHGSITDKEYAGLVDRAKATRALDFRFLLEAGLLERRGRGPGTYYVLG